MLPAQGLDDQHVGVVGAARLLEAAPRRAQHALQAIHQQRRRRGVQIEAGRQGVVDQLVDLDGVADLGELGGQLTGAGPALVEAAGDHREAARQRVGQAIGLAPEGDAHRRGLETSHHGDHQGLGTFSLQGEALGRGALHFHALADVGLEEHAHGVAQGAREGDGQEQAVARAEGVGKAGVQVEGQDALDLDLPSARHA